MLKKESKISLNLNYLNHHIDEIFFIRGNMQMAIFKEWPSWRLIIAHDVYCYVLIACSFFFRFYPPIQRAVCIISTHIHDITFPDDSLSTNNRRWNCWFIITNTKLRGQETWIHISSFRIFPMEDEFSWIFHHNLFFSRIHYFIS